ncbi:hypothetical protein HG535_0A05180 [Zygotorulaspora mrakii]|uniref:Agglutinin-like protein N-terminal domain-containing protein n=1 Tax=Zygotorulaspora mrakii TaxID=42260 RepID=A0A7H9AWQ8_ZYGMR|nr:uncharacterized protein HG535_0A05180 [Zygotorulaspora mrakii]QLG70577.1 hypothetical protein HG535_0A05180 [Zygotorulaspora mrakii]
MFSTSIRSAICLLWLAGIALAKTIDSISFSGLQYSPLTSYKFPHQGWTASFDFDISENVHQDDHFTMNFPLIYRIKFDGNDPSTIVSLNDGTKAFECYVSQQAAFLYNSTNFRCNAITDLSSYSSVSGSITFSFSFSSGGSIYPFELEDATQFHSGTMNVPLTEDLSAEITFDRGSFDGDIYTIGRTTTYDSLETYYLGMKCPNGYLLEGSQTINYDHNDGNYNLDCSSVQGYMAASFNDWLLPLEHKDSNAEVSCSSNTLAVKVHEADSGEMFWINALQSVSEGVNTVQHDVQMQYTCSDTIHNTIYSTQFHTIVEYVIYQGKAYATASVTSEAPTISPGSISATASQSSLFESLGPTSSSNPSKTISTVSSSISSTITSTISSVSPLSSSTPVDSFSNTTIFTTTTTSWTGNFTTTYSTFTGTSGSGNVFTEEIVYHVRIPTTSSSVFTQSTTTSTVLCSLCSRSSALSSTASPSDSTSTENLSAPKSTSMSSGTSTSKMVSLYTRSLSTSMVYPSSSSSSPSFVISSVLSSRKSLTPNSTLTKLTSTFTTSSTGSTSTFNSLVISSIPASSPGFPVVSTPSNSVLNSTSIGLPSILTSFSATVSTSSASTSNLLSSESEYSPFASTSSSSTYMHTSDTESVFSDTQASFVMSTSTAVATVSNSTVETTTLHGNSYSLSQSESIDRTFTEISSSILAYTEQSSTTIAGFTATYGVFSITNSLSSVITDSTGRVGSVSRAPLSSGTALSISQFLIGIETGKFVTTSTNLTNAESMKPLPSYTEIITITGQLSSSMSTTNTIVTGSPMSPTTVPVTENTRLTEASSPLVSMEELKSSSSPTLGTSEGWFSHISSVTASASSLTSHSSLSTTHSNSPSAITNGITDSLATAVTVTETTNSIRPFSLAHIPVSSQGPSPIYQGGASVQTAGKLFVLVYSFCSIFSYLLV